MATTLPPARSSTVTARRARPPERIVADTATVSPSAASGAASTSATATSAGASGEPMGTEITGARGWPPDASAARRTASSGSMPIVERPSVRSTTPASTRSEASSIAMAIASPSAVSPRSAGAAAPPPAAARRGRRATA